MPKLNDAELATFLDSDVLCRLGCLDEDGYPYVVPTWFQYTDGGFYIIPRKRSKWAKLMQQDDRVFLCLDRESGARVLVKGRAQLIEEPNTGGRWVEIAREMVLRYRGEAGLTYLEATMAEPRWLFFVKPEQVTTWQGGSWAAKYKHSEW